MPNRTTPYGSRYTGMFNNMVDNRLDFYVNGTRTVGFTGTTMVPASQPAGWAITSFTEDKDFAGNSTTAADAVKAVASLVNDLKALGLITGTVAA